MLKRYLLLCLLFVSPIFAAEEKKTEKNASEKTEEMATEEAKKPDREKQISMLIEKNIQSGEAVWLDKAEGTFLGLYKENTWKKTQGAILLLHDLGTNADWPLLIQPLRFALPKRGWHTLSLQLPMVTPAEEKNTYLNQFDESLSRVNAGIEHLKQKNISNIVIVGHGIGAAVAVIYINQNPQSSVTALVAISLPGESSLKPPQPEAPAEKPADPEPDSKKKTEKKAPPEPDPAATASNENAPLPDRDLFTEMEQIKIPFLDVFGHQDHQDVLREAVKREEIMQKTDNPAYSQWQVEGADHFFRGVEDQFIRRLRGWLNKHAQDIETPPSSS